MHILNALLQVLELALWDRIYLLHFCMGIIRRGGLKIFFVARHIQVETFLLTSYFFDATHTSSRIFFKGQANLHGLISDRYRHMCGWGHIPGGLINNL